MQDSSKTAERIKQTPQEWAPSSMNETVYLMEDKDGFLVRVPESKLEAWEQAQREPSRPLNRAEQQLVDRVVQSVYGPKK